MAFQGVASSMITGFEYDEDTQQLSVLFNSGKFYYYQGVHPVIAQMLETAPSKGTFLREAVIGVYGFTTVPLPPREKSLLEQLEALPKAAEEVAESLLPDLGPAPGTPP